MGLIWGTLLTVLGVAGAIIIPVTARVVGDDVKEWLPWITRRLVELAVSRLPEQERDRFEEEWWAHINELPGNLAKVFAAWGYLSASKAINHIAQFGDTTRIEEVKRRAIDIASSGLCLIFVLPFILLIYICIKVDSPGPVLVKHKRFGANNIPFDLLKFRTLYVGVPGQPCPRRATPVGWVLRKLYFEELPLLLNVLKGEMSLVGPRPSAADRSAESETPIFRPLHRLKPGITGLAKIYYGKTGTIEQRAEHNFDDDVYYANNRSLRLDFAIIVRTVFAGVLGGARYIVPPAFPPIDRWTPRASLVFILHIVRVFLIGIVALCCLTGLFSAIVRVIQVLIHFLGYL
jgi:lipopolysaccharide/colanic/teichoic acid biosynthesis glycosyltransferase